MSTPLIDLFSDTKTKPSTAMRAAMAAAEVGDERAGEDPTVTALEARGAALLGKEAALYLPSGTMCNEIALAVHCRPGEAVLCEAGAHIVGFEAGGAAALAGVMLEPISGTRGMYSAAQLQAHLRADNLQAPLQRLVAVEQTSNLGGGAIWPLSELRAVAQVAHAAGLATHMDGARLPNAVVASGVPAADFAQGFDSVWIDLSKGLGAPGGALLAGSKAFVREARRWQLRIGGAMRQSGIIAAASPVRARSQPRAPGRGSRACAAVRARHRADRRLEHRCGHGANQPSLFRDQRARLGCAKTGRRHAGAGRASVPDGPAPGARGHASGRGRRRHRARAGGDRGGAARLIHPSPTGVRQRVDDLPWAEHALANARALRARAGTRQRVDDLPWAE
ncbi:aromatic amino acid beta-eliminating lyase/threonine aldolase, partial [mine drainage metagenome]